MAVATGAVVANLYYAQPLLHQIARTFGSGTAGTATVVTASQIGYAAGLLLVVPLGDIRPRRRLVVLMYGVAAAALVVCAAAPALWLFEVGSVCVGAASVAGQIMVPFAADLAAPDRRGRVVARIMTGLLLGILLARTVAGLVAEAAGWRAIYWISACVMVLFALVLARALPGEPARPPLTYGSLVRSSVRLLSQEPVLRRRAWHGACAFAAFSVLWTALAFLLSGTPYHYSNAIIGLFGLAGVAGVAAANLAGNQADADRTRRSTVIAGVLLTASFALLAAGGSSLLALVLGIVVLDAGTQGMQITNQAIVYALRPEARSRINSIYMTCYFVGGAVGSLATGAVMAAAGWHGVCVLGAGFGLASLSMAAYERARGGPHAPPARSRLAPLAGGGAAELNPRPR